MASIRDNLKKVFSELSYDERAGIASALKEQKQEAEMIEWEQQELIASLEEKSPLEEMRFKDGGKNVDITHFISIREGNFPEYFTVNQAKALNPTGNFTAYMQPGTKQYNHVPLDSALEHIADELDVTPSDIQEMALDIRHKRRSVEDMQILLEDAETRQATVANLLEILDELNNPVDKDDMIAKYKRYKELPTFEELLKYHRQRTPQARAADEAKEHEKLISSKYKSSLDWIVDPAGSDIRGIDTPRKLKKRTRRKATKDNKPGLKGVR